MTEVDKYNRSALDIAELHEYNNIVEILKKYLQIPEDNEDTYLQEMTTWHDYYPGIKKGQRYLNHNPLYCFCLFYNPFIPGTAHSRIPQSKIVCSRILFIYSLLIYPLVGGRLQSSLSVFKPQNVTSALY